MRLHRTSAGNPRKLGILPGSFNPFTRAHVELAEAARSHVDEVLLVVPSVFPHKDYSGATLEERIALIESAGLTMPHSIGASERGLFLDIAQECRQHYGPEIRLYFLCGRDAAERILAWDYGRPGVAEEMLQEFELLVAPRGGEFLPPAGLANRIHALEVRGEYDAVSSTEVRERIARGDRWEHLVPESIVERVRKIYS